MQNFPWRISFGLVLVGLGAVELFGVRCRVDTGYLGQVLLCGDRFANGREVWR